MNKAIIAAVLTIVFGGAGLLLVSSGNGKKPTDTSSQQTNDNNLSTQTAAVTINYSDDGFSPKSVTVKAGSVVAVKNNSGVRLDFASDEHPSHRLNTELNLGLISAGETKSFTPSTKGEYGVHNHLRPGDNMTIIVE